MFILCVESYIHVVLKFITQNQVEEIKVKLSRVTCICKRKMDKQSKEEKLEIYVLNLDTIVIVDYLFYDKLILTLW